MKDIGKITGTYLYALATLSILSMPVAYFYQNSRSLELSWIILIPLGKLLRKHSNPARLIVIGYNILGLILSVGVLLFSFSKPALQEALFKPQELHLFAVEVLNPPMALYVILITLSFGASVILITLLLSKKAKEEFLNHRIHSIADSACPE